MAGESTQQLAERYFDERNELYRELQAAKDDVRRHRDAYYRLSMALGDGLKREDNLHLALRWTERTWE